MFKKELAFEYKEEIYVWKLGKLKIWRSHVWDWELISFVFLAGVLTCVAVDLISAAL